MESSCTECGDLITPSPFAPKTRPQLYCSKRCRWRAKNRKRADYHRQRNQTPEKRRYYAAYNRRRSAKRKLAQAAAGKPATCVRYMGWCRDCGEPFITSYSRASFCSPAHKKRQHRSDNTSRRRAQKHDGFRAKVYRADIFKRDGYRCQVQGCGKPLRLDVAVPHPLAATIDHIVPLALGGTHEPTNCQAAHFLCNSSKSNLHAGDQLRLVG